MNPHEKARALAEKIGQMSQWAMTHELQTVILAYRAEVRRETLEECATLCQDVHDAREKEGAHSNEEWKGMTAICLGALRCRDAIRSRITAEFAPGHTDLMVAPETMDKFMEDKPLPEETTMLALTDLAPCPFCGGACDGLSVDGDRVHVNIYCNGCETSGPLASVPPDECIFPLDPAKTARATQQAMRQWNRRAEAIPRDVALDPRDAEIAELKQDVIAFCAPWATQYAQGIGLPRLHLHPTHYDILQRCGARMDDFTRADIPNVRRELAKGGGG